MNIVGLRVTIFDETVGKLKPLLLCKIDQDLYDRFLKEMRALPEAYNDYIAEWVLWDYGMHLAMTTRRDFAILKATVVRHFEIVYPVIYRVAKLKPEQCLQIWLEQKMERALK